MSKIDNTKGTYLPSTKIETIETVSKQSSITIQIRSKSPTIVPSVIDLHQCLIHTFQQLKGSHEQFYNRESAKEIARLIHVFHGNQAPFLLSNWQNITYYPCCTPQYTLSRLLCKYFALSRRKHTCPIFCESCQDKLSKDKMKRNRIVSTLYRTRPFQTLTQEEQMIAYNNRYEKIKSLSLKKID